MSRSASLPLALALVLAASSAARADDDPFAGVLEPAPSYSGIDSIRLRFTNYDQTGHGYQSQAGPIGGPGLETASIQQPQLEIIAHQGKRVIHRFWIPVDIITAASPDSIDGHWDGNKRPGVDVVSQPSRLTAAVSANVDTTWKARPDIDVLIRGAVHIENPFRSWTLGAGFVRRLADGNATFAATLNQYFDWFDQFNIHGDRLSRSSRSTSNGNLALTQLLSPYTVAHLNYGFSAQIGELGNTWNSVPLSDGTRGAEVLPHLRLRHAFVGRVAEWLPWYGALHASYRFYIDDWGVVAHTLQAELFQRITRTFYFRGTYRFHQQNGVRFFTTRAPADLPAPLRTADSDLAPLTAHTLGIQAVLDLPVASRFFQSIRLDASLDRYFRSNDLAVTIVSCSAGFRF